MNHIKSYDQFLLEKEDTAKKIEKDIVKLGEPKDGSKDAEKDAKETSADNDKVKKEPKYHQGYDDREDESIAARTKTSIEDKDVSAKGDRDDSYGKWGSRTEEHPNQHVDKAEESYESEAFKPSADGTEISLDEKKANEDHEEFDDKVLNMGLGDVLAIMKEKDPKGYEDMETYVKKNFAKSADESWFTTMTA